MDESLEQPIERRGANSVLRQFVRKRTSTEQCDLCGASLPEYHQHLLDASTRQISCSCGPCAVLFCGQDGARYKRIPQRVRKLADFEMSDMQWESLMIPISLAFFYRDTASGKVIAMYPSPAGATESLLSLESWEEIVAQNPVLQRMEPDVEAFLANRIGTASDYFIVPIDECYRLVGLIRMHWKGLSGGPEVWKQIQQFFSGLQARCGKPRERADA